jgi:hypothetical protein
MGDDITVKSKATSHAWKPGKATQEIKKWDYWMPRDTRLELDIDTRTREVQNLYPKLCFTEAETKARSQPLYTYVITMDVQINRSYQTSTSKKSIADMPWNELMMLMHPNNKELETMIRQAEHVMLKVS